MTALARFVAAHHRWVLLGWLLLAIGGGLSASAATSALSYGFGLPGQPGYQANQRIVAQFGTGGDNAPVLLVVRAPSGRLSAAGAGPVAAAARAAAPGARVASYATQPQLLAADGRTGVVLVYPRPQAGQSPYGAALPALRAAVAGLHPDGGRVTVTGADALSGGHQGGGVGVLAETLFGGLGALVVLVLVFGSALALMPLAVAAGSILTTFLLVWGLTELTSVSFIVQYLLALIGLGVAIDYSLLIVTRWREERGAGADNPQAVERALLTAGRSVLFSGVTVAVSLAALVALPVPFLRSVGFTGLLIPLLSVLAALTLLPALLLTVGPRLDWPHRRSPNPVSRLWQGIAGAVVRHRWLAAIGSAAVLLVLGAPALGLRLGTPSNGSLASTGGPAAAALSSLDRSGLGAGLSHPIEIDTAHPAQLVAAVERVPGVAGVLAPHDWTRGGSTVLDVWTRADPSDPAGSSTAAAVRRAAEHAGGTVGGGPVQTADFIHAVYGNAWWLLAIIGVVTFLLLARALRSIVLPLKALLLNAISVGAAYGVTVLIWQHGYGSQLLFGQRGSDAITVWVPIAVFAFLFGLSMDYEVFLLARIREEHDAGHDTDAATVRGVARTGRLVTSAALVLFLAFVALSRVPDTDVKILATALALGIVIDATLVRGVLAPALVAALGRVNWWTPGRPDPGPRPGLRAADRSRCTAASSPPDRDSARSA